MSPTAVTDIDRPEPTMLKSQSIRKPRVYTLEPLHSKGLALAREKFELVLPTDPDFVNWRTQAEGLLARNAEVTASDTRELKDNKLRYIAKQGVGVDNFDLDELKRCEIPLMNTPGVNTTAVAELALALIMDVARRVSTIDAMIRGGQHVTKLDGWSGQTLHGRSLGLIGGGNIGLALGRMFSMAFQSKVMVYDPYLKPAAQATWIGTLGADRVSFVPNLDDLLTTADVVSLHVPLMESTRNLIGARELRLMKNSAIIINSARGGIINEEDLAIALEEAQIFGAGLDAFDSEPPSLKKHERFCRLNNVVMTPHIGAATKDAQEETCLSMVQHLVEAFEAGVMRDRVC